MKDGEEIHGSLVRVRPAGALGGRSMQELVALLKSRLAGRVQGAYLFGSAARNELRDESDIDLIIVAHTDITFVDRPRAFGDILDLVPRMDLLVYTTDEFTRLTSRPTAGFWQSVTKDIVQIV